VATELGVPTVVIPYTASVQGAFGLVTSDVVHELLIGRPMAAPGEPAAVDATFEELIARVRGQLAGEGFAPQDTDITRSIDMRYQMQVHVMTAPVLTPGQITAESLAAAMDLFEDLYEQKYGAESTYREAGIELVTFRVRGSGRVDKPDPGQWAEPGRPVEEALVERRSVYLPAEHRMVEVPGYDLESLGVGSVVSGPALVWSPITTVVLNRGQIALVDPYRNLVITAGGESG
jgi:N-methylhydantoinase A